MNLVDCLEGEEEAAQISPDAQSRFPISSISIA
jgi:hypothetical protein